MYIPAQCNNSVLSKMETDRMIGVFIINFEQILKVLQIVLVPLMTTRNMLACLT